MRAFVADSSQSFETTIVGFDNTEMHEARLWTSTEIWSLQVRVDAR